MGSTSTVQMTSQLQSYFPSPSPLHTCCPAPPPMDIRIVDDREPKLEAAEAELAQLRHMLAMAADTEERLKRQLQEVQVKNKMWMTREGAMGELEAEINRLKEALFQAEMRLVSSEGQRAGAAEAIAKLEAELAQLRARLQQYAQMEAEFAEVQRQLQEANNRISNLQNEGERAHAGIASLEQQLKEANDRLFQMKNGFETERMQFRAQMEDAMNRLRFVENQRDEALKQCSFFEAKLKELEERLGKGDQSFTQMRAQFETERLRMKEQLEQCQHHAQGLERQLVEARNAIGRLEGKLRECESKLAAADARILQLTNKIAQLEAEITRLRNELNRRDLKSSTKTTETYKVATFEIAAKLAASDGTDDGLYNDLPIEVEGQGLYRDLLRQGRRPAGGTSATFSGSLTGHTGETYKVQSYEMAERLSRADGKDDGMYNGMPIEVTGQGLYTQLRMARGGSSTRVTSTGGSASQAAGARVTSGSRISSSGGTSGSVSGGETYIVNSMAIAQTLSKMGNDDGTYKGLPIEIKGQGLYRDLRK